MNQIQERVLHLVELHAEKANRYATIRTNWANTGNVYIYADARLSGKPVTMFHYDFQTDSAKFYFGKDNPVIGKDRPVTCNYSDGFDALFAELDTMI